MPAIKCEIRCDIAMLFQPVYFYNKKGDDGSITFSENCTKPPKLETTTSKLRNVICIKKIRKTSIDMLTYSI